MKLKNITLRRLIVWSVPCVEQLGRNLSSFSHSWVALERGPPWKIGAVEILFRQIQAGKVITHLRNSVELLINMFLQWSHCFSRPMKYWRNKTIMIIRHPSVTPYKLINLTKRHDQNGRPTLIFLNCQTSTLLSFLMNMCLTRDWALTNQR